LLVAALRASGIEAYLALLSAGDDQDVSAELPGLGMFNHAIVYVPGVNGGKDLWIDATAEYSRVGTLPAQDADRLALIIREGTRELMLTPALRSADNQQVETREFFLAEYGPARVIETTETHGTVEGEYRTWYAGAGHQVAHRRSQDLHARHLSRQGAGELRAHLQRRLLEAVLHEDRDEGRAGRASRTSRPRPWACACPTSPRGCRITSTSASMPSTTARNTRRAPRTWCSSPFVTVWKYRIQPPPGFQARELPADGVMKVGPARLLTEYREEFRRLGECHLDLRHHQGPLHAGRDRRAGRGTA
jgi:hypothetical protein